MSSSEHRTITFFGELFLSQSESKKNKAQGVVNSVSTLGRYVITLVAVLSSSLMRCEPKVTHMWWYRSGRRSVANPLSRSPGVVAAVLPVAGPEALCIGKSPSSS